MVSACAADAGLPRGRLLPPADLAASRLYSCPALRERVGGWSCPPLPRASSRGRASRERLALRAWTRLVSLGAAAGAARGAIRRLTLRAGPEGALATAGRSY